jgi:hypothetical protein
MGWHSVSWWTSDHGFRVSDFYNLEETYFRVQVQIRLDEKFALDFGNFGNFEITPVAGQCDLNSQKFRSLNDYIRMDTSRHFSWARNARVILAERRSYSRRSPRSRKVRTDYRPPGNFSQDSELAVFDSYVHKGLAERFEDCAHVASIRLFGTQEIAGWQLLSSDWREWSCSVDPYSYRAVRRRHSSCPATWSCIRTDHGDFLLCILLLCILLGY